MACLVIELDCDCGACRAALLFAQIAVAANTPVLAPDFRAVAFDYRQRPILNSCCPGAATEQIHAYSDVFK
jgi:hypothetical protein